MTGTVIKYLRNKEISKKAWDACIEHSLNGIVYGYSWYLDLTCPGWDALVEGDYERVMPLPNRQKFGVKYVYPPFFIQQLGVFSVDLLTEEKVFEFISAIPREFRYVELNLNTFNKLRLDGIQTKERLTHELDLIPAYQLLASHYADNTKRNVNKGKKHNLKLDFNATPDQVVELFRNNRGRDLDSFTGKDYLVLQALITVARNLNHGQIWGVADESDKLLAGAFFIEANGKVVFLFSGNTDEGKQKGAMPFLIDSFIKFNSQRNLILDFEGSDDPDLARFYKGFGAKECVYLQVTRNTLPWPFRLLKN